MSTSSKIAVALLPLLLAACGGGGGDAGTVPSTPSDPVYKYLGRWVDACDVVWAVSAHPSYPNGVSEAKDITIGKISANQYGIVTVERTYHNTTCAGSPVAEGTILGTAQIRGTKTVAFGAVDKVILEQGDTPLKLITQVKDGRLYNTSAATRGIELDAEGYPTSVVPSEFWAPVSVSH